MEASSLLRRVPELCLAFAAELAAEGVKQLVRAVAARCTGLTTLRVVGGLQEDEVEELLAFQGVETLCLENLVFKATFIKAIMEGAFSSLKVLDIGGAFVSPGLGSGNMLRLSSS